MSLAPSITQQQLLTSLGNYILGVALAGTSVIVGQVNRTPTPLNLFVVMTVLTLPQQGMPSTTRTNPVGDSNTGSENYRAATRWHMQIDCYGDQAGENAQLISKMFKTNYACLALASSGVDMAPLYATEPRNLQFINGEQQYERRFSFELVGQYNPIISVPLEFANELVINAESVESLA
jgi:hypothetical protein